MTQSGFIKQPIHEGLSDAVEVESSRRGILGFIDRIAPTVKNAADTANTVVKGIEEIQNTSTISSVPAEPAPETVTPASNNQTMKWALIAGGTLIGGITLMKMVGGKK